MSNRIWDTKGELLNITMNFVVDAFIALEREVDKYSVGEDYVKIGKPARFTVKGDKGFGAEVG